MSEKLIEKKDMWLLFWRGIFLENSWNYERMQGLGYAWIVLPILKRLYKNDPQKLQEAVMRSMEFFNTQPNLAMPIIGTAIAMEERNALYGDVDEKTISSVKVSMMGPFAGIGDSFFYYTVIPICAGIGVSLSTGGSLLGPLTFLLLYNIFNIGSRFFGVKYGYKFGKDIIEKISGSSLMQRLSEFTTIIGLMVLGVMSATMIEVPLSLVIGEGEQAMTLLEIFDSIMPGILPLAITLTAYFLIKKGVSVTKLLFGIIGLSVLGAAVGLF